MAVDVPSQMFDDLQYLKYLAPLRFGNETKGLLFYILSNLTMNQDNNNFIKLILTNGNSKKA